MTAEHALIQTLRQWVPHDPADWGDDAFWEPATRRVYSVDAFVEGVHFRRDWMDWRSIGHKCAAAAWSDVAAMGARPLFWLVSLGLPDDLAHDPVAVGALYQGMTGVLEQTGHRAALIGGDTVHAPQLTLSLTVIGEVTEGHQVGLRSAARAADIIVTTGWPGLSALGLHALAHRLHGLPEAIKAHQHPMPRLAAGNAMARLNTRYALMDISDGLADAALQIAQASGVSLVMEAECLPRHEALLTAQKALGLSVETLALYGGEDFELLACLPAEDFNRLPAEEQAAFTLIGRVEPVRGDSSAWLVSASGKRTPLTFDQSFQHFSTPGNLL